MDVTPLVQKSGRSGGPPWVLLHGFTGSAASWRRVASQLRGDVVVPHLPGHHENAPVSGSFEENVIWLADLIEASCAGPMGLVGYSLGARMALGVALRLQERLRELWLIGVNPGAISADERQRRQQVDRERARTIRREGLPVFVDAWERLPLFESQAAVAQVDLAAQRATRLAHDPEQLARSLEFMGLSSMPNCWARLGKIDAPVHLVVGALDGKFLQIARRIHESTPTVEIHVVDSVGHNVPLEAPDALVALLQGV